VKTDFLGGLLCYFFNTSRYNSHTKDRTESTVNLIYIVHKRTLKNMQSKGHLKPSFQKKIADDRFGDQPIGNL
jgi:hypothetical protein